MGKIFSVEVRKECKLCNSPITEKRFRTYCSDFCRNKRNNKIHQQKYGNQWANRKRAEYGPGKRQCLICGGWYIQVGSHVYRKHELTAREYKEQYDLPISLGVIPSWYKELKGEIAIENKTYLNLEKGKKMRYKKGDKRAKAMSGWKGRGSKGYIPPEGKLSFFKD